jgi:predicted outer membrane repeat protein
MGNVMTVNSRMARLTPLTAALLAAGVAQAASLSAPIPAAWQPGDHGAVAALFRALDEVAARRPARMAHVAATLPVSTCADNGTAGTLRSALAAAGEGDTIDLGGLHCSTITLTQGAIPVLPDDLTIIGPGSEALAIDGAGVDRVFVHYGYGTLDVRDLAVRNGVTRVTGYHVTGGACIISNGYVRIERASVSGCLSEGEGAYGGGITARSVYLYSSTLSGNTALGSHPGTFTAAYGGGAMAYRGVAYVYRSTLTGNRATFHAGDTHGSYDTGGGVFSDQGGYAYGSTFAGNYSFGTGGGIATHGPFAIAQSTFSGNTAMTKGGGAIFVRTFTPMRIDNSTMTGNVAAKGGGVYLTGARKGVSMTSSIVAGNRAGSGADFAAVVALTAMYVGGSNNLVQDVDANVILPADTLDVDPQLMPLGDYGGPTRTHALRIGSPALGAGSNPNAYPHDQRGAGFPRSIGGSTDIGAFQGAIALPRPTPAPTLSGWALAALSALLAWLGCKRRMRG